LLIKESGGREGWGRSVGNKDRCRDGVRQQTGYQK
jgi:hypothetical protein